MFGTNQAKERAEKTLRKLMQQKLSTVHEEHKISNEQFFGLIIVKSVLKREREKEREREREEGQESARERARESGREKSENGSEH